MADTKSDPKVAPKVLGDVIALRKAKEKIEQENTQLKTRIARLEKRLEIVDLTEVEDEDLKNVKQMFLQREKELDDIEAKLNSRQTDIETLESSYKEREKGDLIQSLASKYKLDAEILKGVEDPEKEALRLYVERLNSGKEEKLSPEEVFESAPAGGKIRKDIFEMTPVELKEFEKAHAAK